MAQPEATYNPTTGHTETLISSNPYTPPPASTLQALKDAALRGVDVRWIAPDNNDIEIMKGMGESMYKDLLEAGVRIYEWLGPVMHAKQL